MASFQEQLRVLSEIRYLGVVKPYLDLSYIRVIIKYISTIGTFTRVKELEQVSITDLIDSTHLDELYKIRRFLENCLDCEFSSIDSYNFYVKLAHVKGVTLDHVKNELLHLHEDLDSLIELQSQIDSQMKQLDLRLKK